MEKESPVSTLYILMYSTVGPFRFLGTIISQDLKWETNIVSIMKKAQESIYFQWQLKAANSILWTCYWVCPLQFHHCLLFLSHWTRQNQTTENGPDNHLCNLPIPHDLLSARVRKRAAETITNPSHNGDIIFKHFPNGRCGESLCVKRSI